MSNASIVLVGGPNSGKSNFIGRLWVSLSNAEGGLLALSDPDKITYVESLVAHLFQGKFAPRSDSSLEEGSHDLTIDVALRDNQDKAASLVVPDVLGEIWKKAVTTSELPQVWYDRLTMSSSALIFVRVHSDDNHEPLDWVTARGLLESGLADGSNPTEIPTQVELCELLRILENTLDGSAGRPRVVVVVSAWDLLDEQARSAGPTSYLKKQFPLFAGRLINESNLDVKVVGLSVLGCDVSDPVFKVQIQEHGIVGRGYVVEDGVPSSQEQRDISLPIQWLLGS